jgi:EpsD family peptidyl-prolyl cis-trans isomerase
MLLTLCSIGARGADSGSQSLEAAAEVNGENITSDEIQWETQEPHSIPGFMTDPAVGTPMDRLIERRLLAQQALSVGLDQTTRVQSALTAARTEVLARAYLETRIGAVARPSSQEILKYYIEHPALFSARRIYSIREVLIGLPPDKADELRRRLRAAKSIESFAGQLKAEGIAVKGNQALRPAEQLPLTALDDIAAMKVGEPVLNVAPNGSVTALVVDASHLEPVEISKASPVIEQFLINDQRRSIYRSEVESLREKAKIRVHSGEPK